MIDYDAPGVYELMAETRDCIERGSLYQTETHQVKQHLGEAAVTACIAGCALVSAYAQGYDTNIQSTSEMMSQGMFFGMVGITVGGTVMTGRSLFYSVRHAYEAWRASD